MATKKLSDYFNFTLPASGGFQVANSTPSAIIKPPATTVNNPALNVPVGSSLSQLSIPQAPAAPISLSPTSPLASIYPSAVKQPVAPVGPVAPVAPVTPSATPLFSGATGSAGPTGATGATAAQVPASWMNPDGTYKTPEQIADEAGTALANAHGNADVGTLALSQFGDGGTTQDAITAARKVDNTRNDIASGETDPYKVASQSGIAYTPAELKAIENAYAGVYDPALDTALAKVQDKQAADKSAADQAASLAQIKAQQDAPYTLGKDDVRYDSQGNPIAVGISSDSGPAGVYTPGADPTADAWVKFVQNGGPITSVPDTYKNSVAQGLAAVDSTSQLSKTSLDALGIINQLSADPAIDSLSGTGFIGGLEHPSSLFPGTAVQNAQNLAKQLQATISLANRQQLKGSGAISDFEFKVLGDAATALGLDGNGRTNLSADQFKTQLANLKLKLSVGPLKTLTDDQVQFLASPAGGSATPDEIRAIDNPTGFSSVGKTSASTLPPAPEGTYSSAAINRPQRNNNPGDLKPGGIADKYAVGVSPQGDLVFASPAVGLNALKADVSAKVNGQSAHLPANPTIAQLAKVYAEDPNYGVQIAKLLGVPTSTPTQNIPLALLTHAIAVQEGFYA